MGKQRAWEAQETIACICSKLWCEGVDCRLSEEMAKSGTILGKSGQKSGSLVWKSENWNLFSTWGWHVPGLHKHEIFRRREESPLRRKSPREGRWKRKILDISLFKVTHAFYVYNTLICSSLSCSLNECTSVMSPPNTTNIHACNYRWEGDFTMM